MLDYFPYLVMAVGTLLTIGLAALALVGPSPARVQSRRLSELRERHSGSSNMVEAQMRRITANRETRVDAAFIRLLPKPAELAKKLAMTGRNWTVGQYGIASAAVALGVAIPVWVVGAPMLLALFAGVLVGAGLPYAAVNILIAQRVAKFTTKFPDAIELLVRGLRSGLPITETMGVVGQEVPGPVGEEFRSVADKMKIGRSMDVALQETADRLGTPEFQFFVITIAIQRETGGNLAETLANLAEVLRKRAQMKLKVKAMSSESKASAYIIGALPFGVFFMIYQTNPGYMMQFFTDQRLIVAGLGAFTWMGIGAFIMSKMIRFEI